MGTRAIKLPDVGEGVAEAEIVEWPIAVGDPVRADDIVAVVMTDKASVEIPSSVEGTLSWIGGEVGDVVAVGSDLVRIEVAGEGDADTFDTDGNGNRVQVKPPATRRDDDEDNEHRTLGLG